MAQVEDKILFTPETGLNYDDDKRLMGRGDARYRLNTRYGISATGNTGVMENIIGNKLVIENTGAGENTIIGSCQYKEADGIIYFNYNSLGNHSIIAYLPYATPVNFVVILVSPLLNFKLTSKITHANVIDGMLYWTDGYFNSFIGSDFNPPRKINIQKAIDYMNGSADGYQAITFGLLDRIKRPYLFSPTAEYMNDADWNLNNLSGKLFQFCVRYIYDDNERSVLSPYSKIALPIGSESIDGYFIQDVSFNNRIDVTFNDGGELVNYIEVYARQSNALNFYLCETINKNDYVAPFVFEGTTTAGSNVITITVSWDIDRMYVGQEISCTLFTAYITSIQLGATNQITISEDATVAGVYDMTATGNVIYRFYNNMIGAVISDAMQAKYFDYVPQICSCQEFISDNRLVDGQITEGYDNVEVILRGTYGYAELEYYPAGAMPSISHTYLPPAAGYYHWFIEITGGIVDGCIYFIEVTQPTTTAPFIRSEVTYTTSVATDTLTTITIKIQNAINAVLAHWQAQQYHIVDVTFIAPNQLDIRFDATAAPPQTTVNAWTQFGFESSKTFHDNSNYSLGIVYYDMANRSGYVNTNQNCDILIPGITTEVYPIVQPNDPLAIRFYIDYSIHHQPPDWATHYQIVCTKSNNITYWEQYTIYSWAIVGNYIQIDIWTASSSWRTANPKVIVPDYVWQKGDRIRFIGRRTNHAYFEYLELFNKVYDFEILSQIATGEINIDRGADITFMGQEPDTYVVEVYTPKSTFENKIFYEIGEVYDIGNPHTVNRYHKGNIIDQNPLDYYGTPATGRINGLDAFARLRATDLATFPVISQSFSDYYTSQVYDIGRINVVSESAKRQTLPICRWSGKIFENTQVNNLSSFDYNDYIEFKNENGAIFKLKDVGYTLKVVQQTKNNSVYVGRISTEEAAGGASTILSQSVLGTVMIPIEDWGCVNPESYVKYNRSCYFLDIINGRVIRDAANGMTVISDYKMKTYFKDISAVLLAGDSENISCIGSYDTENEEYILSLRNSNDLSSQVTIAFNETTNRWKTFYSYKPEWMAYMGKFLVSFIDGDLWLHHALTTVGGSYIYNNYYGVQYDQIVEAVSNQSPDKIKSYNALALHTNNNKYVAATGTYNWEAESITIESSSMYPSGMTSRIRAARFISKEGVLYAEFLNDMNTPGFTDAQEALINGRKLRGEVITIRLKNSSPNFVQLSNISIKFVSSEYSY